MAPVDGPFLVARKHPAFRQIDDVLPSLGKKFFVQRLDVSVFCIGSAAVHVALLRHDDRRLRALRAQVADERLVVLLDIAPL